MLPSENAAPPGGHTGKDPHIMSLQITVPEGVTVHRDNYIPANQHSKHHLRPGTYDVRLTTVNGHALREGERPYYAAVTLDTDGGEHVYYGSVMGRSLEPEVTTLKPGVVLHLRLYSYEILEDDGSLKPDAHFWATGDDGRSIHFPITIAEEN